MARMLEVTLKSDPKKLVAALRSKPGQIVNALESRLNAVLYQLASYIVGRKLSGQMLARRTGILAGSVRTEPAKVVGAQIIGRVVAAEGPAFYGRILEEGSRAHQIFSVKSRALAFMMDGRKVFARRVFHPGMAARPFMRTSLEENAENIRAQLQAALDEELQK